jgi:hypothetical protein
MTCVLPQSAQVMVISRRGCLQDKFLHLETEGPGGPSGTPGALSHRMQRWILVLILLSAAGCTSTATDEPVITCMAGADCDAKWSRAMQWLQQNSSWKMLTTTDTQLMTEGPLDTAKPAFEVTKVAHEDGRTFHITMRAWCGTGDCNDVIRRLRTSFDDYVLAR